MSRQPHPTVLTLVLTMLLVGLLPAQDWPQYGGPNGNGQLNDAATTPSADALALQWTVRTYSPGFGGPAVVDNRVYFLDRRGDGVDGEDVLRVFDLASGEQVGEFAHPAPGVAFQGFPLPQRSGPVSVPAVTADHIYLTGNQARVYCLQRDDLILVWSKQLDTRISHGSFSPSPLVVADRLYLSYTKADVGDVLEAWNTADGSLLWSTSCAYQEPEPHGMVWVVHASPIFRTVHGVAQVIATHKRANFAVEPDTGAVLWQYEGYPRGTIQAEIAIDPEGRAFATSGHDGCSAMFRVTRSEGSWQVDEIYTYPPQDRGKARACSEWRRGYWYDGHLYHVSNHYAKHGLLCMDDGGEVLWRTRDHKREQPQFGQSDLTIVNGVALAMNGLTLHLIDLDPSGYRSLGSLDMFQDHGEAWVPDPTTIATVKFRGDYEGRRKNIWINQHYHLTWAKHAYADGLFLTRNPVELACARVAAAP